MLEALVSRQLGGERLKQVVEQGDGLVLVVGDRWSLAVRELADVLDLLNEVVVPPLSFLRLDFLSAENSWLSVSVKSIKPSAAFM